MSDLTFVLRNPDCGYVGRQLWLPKKHVNVRSLKAGLEFPVMDDLGISYLQLWEDVGSHLVVPREFIPRWDYPSFKFPIYSVGPTTFKRVRFESNVVLDKREPHKDTQRQAFSIMMNHHSGILNLACGKGKTCIALHHIASKGVPAIVIVNNTTLINQWVDRVHEHLKYVEGGVGIIQGPPKTWDWEGRGIVIAMIHSLSLRVNEIPAGLDRYFGGIYYDEVHHLSAPLFSQTAPLFYGERHGLTATEKREDGLEMIYQYHIGPVYHSDLFQDLKPRIYFQETPIKLDTTSSAVREAINDKRGMLNIPKLRSYLGSLPEANEFIAEKLQKPLLAGRKILVLSHSVDQLRNLNMMFEDSGLCTGSEPSEERIRTLQSKQITFGTLQLVKEALDEASLDTLFILTPFGSQHVEDGGLNTLQQGMGRLQRPRPGKKTPVVVILDYIYIPKFHKMANKLKTLVRRWPKEQGGPLEYTTVKPYQED